jgi:hypothetical protein
MGDGMNTSSAVLMPVVRWMNFSNIGLARKFIKVVSSSISTLGFQQWVGPTLTQTGGHSRGGGELCRSKVFTTLIRAFAQLSDNS